MVTGENGMFSFFGLSGAFPCMWDGTDPNFGPVTSDFWNTQENICAVGGKKFLKLFNFTTRKHGSKTKKGSKKPRRSFK
jgi:hypothetical protein